MTTLVKNVLTAMGAVMASFFLLAFVMWDINPGNWTETARAWCAIQTFLGAGIAVGIANS